MKVFISHPIDDEDLAIELRDILEKEDKIETAFIAQKKKEYDIEISEKIIEQINDSDYLVAIITKNSISSASVNQELGYAQGTKLSKIPMVEEVEEGEEVKKGFLIYGKDDEKFTRENFTEVCLKVRDYILVQKPRNKLDDQEKKDLLQNVYDPCYNQMKNVYERGEFIMAKPENPWEAVSASWQDRTESDVKELFEEYTKEIKVWNNLFVERESEFTTHASKVLIEVSVAFEHEQLLKNGSIPLNDTTSMTANTWIQEFRYVLFDPRVKDANQLHQRLLEFAKITKNNHEQWLDKFSAKTDLYRTLTKLLPDIIKEHNIRICDEEITLETKKLQGIIEKLTKKLQEKIKHF